jgi:hypothetical protein
MTAPLLYPLQNNAFLRGFYGYNIFKHLLLGMSKSLRLMILMARLKFCWCILNFAGAAFEVKVVPAKDPRQQHSAGARQKIPSL